MKVGIVGACGHMGQALITYVLRHPAYTLTAAFESPGSPMVGQRVTAVLGTAVPIETIITAPEVESIKSCEVIIDFSQAEASVAIAQWCAQAGTPLVIGTTGINAEQELQISEAARKVAIFKASNMSIGIQVMLRLVESATHMLSPLGYDTVLLESHHKHKKDAPSGTALTILETLAQARKGISQTLFKNPSNAEGSSTNTAVDAVKVHSIRGGSTVGEHSLMFLGEGENLEIKHTATSRKIFVEGALTAATWVQTQAPGLYGFKELLSPEC